jgi:hypothetical protein
MVEMAVETDPGRDDAELSAVPPWASREQLLEQAIHMDVALSALAGCQIEFEIGISARRVARM